MNISNNYLLDQEFLKKLDKHPNKVTYAKIILLTFDEHPVQEIQGKITQGSVNIDGNAAVRRSCSLSMVTPQIDINDTYWTLKNKFKLEVGVENHVDEQYPDIVWFKQGTFVFTSLNQSISGTNYNISLSGKDKMCLLNGEIGGAIVENSVDFGKIEEYIEDANGDYVYNIEDIPIVKIVKNMVHLYGGEPLENIVINDVDKLGLELLEYRGEQDMYMARNEKTQGVTNMITKETQKYQLITGGDEIDGWETEDVMIREIPERIKETDEQGNNIYYTYYSLNSQQEGINDNAARLLSTNGDIYNIIKMELGDEIGYRTTDLIYPADLIANVGESIVTILDKIKNMFSDFEYFYDIDGMFTFQKKKTYLNTSWNHLKISEDEIYADSTAYTSSVAYSFEDGVLLSAFTNNPAINNVKNDFSVWGKRKTATGAEIPVHMRYAIDIKPKYYYPLRYEQVYNKETKKWDRDFSKLAKIAYVTDKYEGPREKDITYIETDWRELIYQMAYDYYQLNHVLADFPFVLSSQGENKEYYPTGKTGYEQYYTDIQGFWRQLYCETLFDDYEDKVFKRQTENGWLTEGSVDWENTGWLQSKLRYNMNTTLIQELQEIPQYLEEDNANAVLNKLENEYLIDNEDIKSSVPEAYRNVLSAAAASAIQETQNRGSYNWNINIEDYPDVLNFWFDFMNIQDFGSGENENASYASELSKYSVQAIGSRPKAIKDDKVTGIYFKDIPQVLFLTQEDYDEMLDDLREATNLTGYTWIRLSPSMENYFTISARGKTAKDEMDNLMYQHTYATENVTLTSVPIYHLQPNTRIFVKDNDSGINGEYILTKITIPLAYNGTSSLTASKAVERIY